MKKPLALVKSIAFARLIGTVFNECEWSLILGEAVILVHDHGAMGVICSLDCYNIVIENNKVSNSAGSGIMFSRNTTNSIARNNYVHNEEQCIFYHNHTITKFIIIQLVIAAMVFT